MPVNIGQYPAESAHQPPRLSSLRCEENPTGILLTPPRSKCILVWGYRDLCLIRVALPFCSIHLTARKPTKPLPILNTLGDHIKKRRLKLSLLQRQLAERLGVKADTVLNWEHNRTRPTLRHLPKVTAFLGYDPNPSDPKNLREKVLKYRKRCGISQKELARQIGIDPTTLSRLEKRKGRCSPSIMRKVSAFLDSYGHRG